MDSLYIFIRQDVTSYFRSSANRANVLIVDRVQLWISRCLLTEFENIDRVAFERAIQVLHFPL